MKKTIVFAVLLLAMMPAQGQLLRFGVKAGANFSNLDGASFDTKTRTSFHFGATAEIKLPLLFAIQPELLYSSQGAKVDSEAFDDIQYDYITVPVLVKLYVVPKILSIDIGPQFSFLVNDNNDFDIEDSSTFDFAALGGLGLNIGDHLFLQGRYVLGLTDTSSNADVKNKLFQLSAGYRF